MRSDDRTSVDLVSLLAASAVVVGSALHAMGVHRRREQRAHDDPNLDLSSSIASYRQTDER